MTQLRLTLQEQRDDIGNSFRQILFGNTRKSSYNTVSNDSEHEMDYIDDSDKDDIEPYSSSSNSSIYKQSDSSNTTGVAPNSSPSACSQIEEIKDPFVGALTKRHSLTQLHEWLNSIKCSVNTSISMVTSKHLDLDLTRLTVAELSLNTLPFSIQLNPSPLAWSGYAKYENFKPWKTKQSFHPRHPHCWFAPSPQPQQTYLRSNRLRNKPGTKPLSVEKCTTTAYHRRMR